MLDLISIGDIKLDTFVVLPEDSLQCQLKMPECSLCLDYGKKIPVGEVDSQIAGSAPNVAVGLARMELKTAVYSFMGEDGIRHLALECLEKEKVGTQFIKTAKDKKSSFSVVLNYKGERTILASHVSYPYHLIALPKTKWLYVCELGLNYKALCQQLVKYIKKEKILLGLNPGAIQILERADVLYKLLTVTEILFVNLEEAHILAKEETEKPIHRLVALLFKMGPKKVVITDGAKGAYCFDGMKLDFCPALPIKLIEATGAGDSFAAGFIGALLNGFSSQEALRWGAVNAASVIGFVGPQQGLLDAKEIKKRVKKYSNKLKIEKL